MVRKKLRRHNLFILFIIFVLIAMFFFFIKHNSIIDKKIVNIRFEVSDATGFDLNNSYLELGRIMRGGSATRNLIIYNDYQFPIYIELNAYGNAANFLSYQKISYLNPGMEMKIPVSVYVGNEADYGVYEGKFVILIKKGI